MDLIQAYAKKTGQTIKTSIEGGTNGTGTSGHGLQSGVMREAIVLMREISRGNWSRVPGSASILVQRLGLLKYVLHPVVGITAAIAGGFALAFFHAKKLTDEMSKTFAVPDFVGRFIVRQEQTWANAREALKETNREIAKSIELYNSAAKAAERVQEKTKARFEHERKMNEFSQEDRTLEINAAERAETLKNKEAELNALMAEEADKRKQAEAISIKGKAIVDEDVRKAKEKADAARKFLEEDKAARKAEAENKNPFVAPWNKMSDEERAEVERRRAGEVQKANDAIQAEKDLLQFQADNNEALKRRDELQKEATASAKRAAEMGQDLPNLRAQFEQRNKDEAEEYAAKQGAQAAGNMRFEHGHLTALQNVGAYAMDAALVDVNKKQLHKLVELVELAKRNHNGSFGQPFGGTRF